MATAASAIPAEATNPFFPPRHNNNNHHHGRTRWKIARLAFATRVIALLAMALSCSILPDFYPGDDVLQFDLRLMMTTSSSHDDDEVVGKDRCFCLQGHGCDADWKSSRRRINGDYYLSCADDSNDVHETIKRYIWLDRFYAFILPPVTKWDAARFLSLSIDPWARYPPGANEDGQTCTGNNTLCEVPPSSDIEDAESRQFYSSEQAHAFFPFFPLAIRYTTSFLVKVLPINIRPPTYESTTALAAIIINMLAFVIASISLYDLTIFLLKRETLEKTWNTTKKNDDNDQSKLELEVDASHRLLATTTAQLFCINPAGVFFTTAYSESMFAMLTFAGHAIAARGQCCNWGLKRDAMAAKKLQKGNGIQFRWLASFYWIAPTILWMLASFTRSNGTFSSIWLVLIGISKCCSCIDMSHMPGKSKNTTKVVTKCLSTLLFHGMLALIVAYPVYFHDNRGYDFHCQETAISQSHLIPNWCGDDRIGSRFSLYAYVQRKHWNVGLFRYYEWKQIPNFILALPVLALSFAAAAFWIAYSWDRHMGHELKGGKGSPFGRIFMFLKQVFTWAFLALSHSSYSLQQLQLGKTGSSNAVPSSTIMDSGNLATMLLGPKFLSYYAILAGFALVGTFLAHVQISTRLICSSCPALYWFLASFIVKGQPDSKGKCSGFGGINECTAGTPKLLVFYFALYNILGIIMHVNWLPWT